MIILAHAHCSLLNLLQHQTQHAGMRQSTETEDALEAGGEGLTVSCPWVKTRCIYIARVIACVLHRLLTPPCITPRLQIIASLHRKGAHVAFN